MVVEIPLPLGVMPGNVPADLLRAALTQFYAASPVVTVAQDLPSGGEMLLRASMEPWDGLTLHVMASADGEQARLVAVLDNLGKGASGAAVQTLNLMAGLDETAGLRL
jgi:N-acetyl-gamma-glutamyl-phosphate reductase